MSIREHWEEVEDQAREYFSDLKETALPKRRKLTEREQLQRYLSYGPKDFNAMRNWLSEEGKSEEFDRYIQKMEGLRSKYGERK